MSKKVTNPVNNTISNQAPNPISNQVPNPIPRIDPEFKALIPPLSPEEYTQLEQNILADKKCRDAIVVWGDTLVDGYNRMEICIRHGITFEIKEIDFISREEAMIWMLDNQLGRRNLTDAMRIELAISKTELLRQQARENQRRAGGDKSKTQAESGVGALFTLSSKPETGPINVHKAVAMEAGVSHGVVQNYMDVVKHGTPELQVEVKSGKLKIGTARRLLDQNYLQKKLKLANRIFYAIERNVTKLRAEQQTLTPDQLFEGEAAAMEELNARLTNLLKQARELRRAYQCTNNQK